MILLYTTLGALLLLAGFAFFIGRQNRDLLRARAYREFAVRLVPALLTAAFVAGLPFVMKQATVENYGAVLLLYLGGAAAFMALAVRAVAPEERRAAAAFRSGEYEKATAVYESLLADRPLARYYSALAATLHAEGNLQAALEAADQAIKRDRKLGAAYFNRASVLAESGEKARARGDLQMVFRADSTRALRKAATDALETVEKP